ncbi:ligninase H2 precursor [Microdochium trichocladiopsis]|uniref:Peroxidase n=1 Tax=Microdochium trichocladiopsis TaxID=1682393 RepID=A0A9P8Y2U8_9PEZI|nr:ligninase H2 precursor [Microdochium trichocladiopsis]KAH7028170.1 ligninase H2 precursor [Microdochium trichocladiopsis]
MKPSLVVTLALCHVPSSTLAYPGMAETLADIQARTQAGGSGSGTLEGRSTDLLGDLLSSVATAIGTTIAGILKGTASAVADAVTYKAPGALGSDACNKDKLCVWKYISDDLASSFNGCSDLARAAIRLGFHDAATWDKSSPYGGADGSIVLSGNAELGRLENRGLSPVAAFEKSIYDKYSPYGKPGMADIIQLAANVATVVCPGGPRIRTFAGRKDDSRAGPTGKLPSPVQSAEALIALFQAKTFTASDLVALLGAHSTSRQQFFDPSRAGLPQDSTPQTWDTRYYQETLSVPLDSRSIVVFPSDKNIATYQETKGTWNGFAGVGGQGRWARAYASAYFRMSMLGVTNMNNLYDITRVLPLPR